ncbi:DNA circularization N-terminal domain-containing protein [uncultured Kiloniella sp.]|uniref:DNA circularization protein n=1 Tax=uncultured Kiloniella sp. TaxID=1133091 RepID=UPI002613C223|nr:DNA circularization N-terminal domain-containing protein [uncultured Kiloniella sp.]
MSWKDKLRPASLDDVPFEVFSHSADVAGRQIALHEFPGKDKSHPEDMRKKTSDYSVEAYVIGEDYFEKRDNLIAVCGKPGARKLVHPWLGSLDVICVGCKLTETTREGRMASFTLTFIEAGENLYPSAQPDTAAKLNTDAITAKNFAIQSFADDFKVTGFPGFIREDAANVVSLAAGNLSEQASIFGSGVVDVDLQNKVTNLTKSAPQLTGDPALLGGELSETIGYFSSTQAPSVKLVESLPELSGFADDLPQIPATTATRARQKLNTEAITSLVRRAGIVSAVQSVPGLELSNRSSALSLQDNLVGSIDDELDILSVSEDDNTFNAFAVLRTSVVEHLKARTPYLAQVVDVAIDTTVPALVQAYNIYDDASREGELIQRNNLAHPGFVPGGENLEILIDGITEGGAR